MSLTLIPSRIYPGPVKKQAFLSWAVPGPVNELLLILRDYAPVLHSELVGQERKKLVFWPLPVLDPSLSPILSISPHFSHILNPAIPTQITELIILVRLGNDRADIKTKYLKTD